MICPKCKQALLQGARFCGSCGLAINSNPAPAQATLIRPAAARGPAAAAQSLPATGWAATFIDRIKNIVLTPKTEWPVIAAEPTRIAELYTGFFAPLAALSALVSFIRMSVIGYGSVFGVALRTPVATGLEYSIGSFALALLGLYLAGFIISVLAPTFGGRRDLGQALKVAAYSATPVLAGSVLSLLPMFATLLQLAAAIYAIYLLYLGLPQLMHSARERAVGYTVAVIICGLLVGVVLAVANYFSGFGRYGALSGFGAPALTREEQQRQTTAGAINLAQLVAMQNVGAHAN